MDRDDYLHVIRNIWIKAVGDVDVDDIDYKQIDPLKFTMMMIFLFTAFKSGRGGGEMREIQWSHFKFERKYISINNPSKNNNSSTKNKKEKAKKVFPSHNGRGLYEVLHLFAQIRPIFPDKHKYANCAWLKPLRRMNHNGKTNS